VACPLTHDGRHSFLVDGIVDCLQRQPRQYGSFRGREQRHLLRLHNKKPSLKKEYIIFPKKQRLAGVCRMNQNSSLKSRFYKSSIY
jgi:hypothetical protein